MALAMGAVLAVTGCGSGTGAAGGTGPASSPASSQEPAPDAAKTTALLQLNEQLRQQLGPAYAESWIEGTVLHVAVTTQAATKVVTEAGAVPLLVTFNASQLEDAVRAVSRWQSTLPAVQARAVHKIIPDGRAGTVTIYVAAEQLAAVTGAAAADKPAGNVPLLIKESAGLPTPQ
ncbi:hypothetical protein B5P43_31625 [Bacillus sp. SRB_336]|nr:hypothetical protein B5P43_31625 [Bacillus sp. SRB_336]